MTSDPMPKPRTPLTKSRRDRIKREIHGDCYGTARMLDVALARMAGDIFMAKARTFSARKPNGEGEHAQRN